MLQINLKTYASDALEDAMRLAQTKALNSYSWSDMLNYLNYTWMDIYQQIAFVDEGYYSITVRLTDRLTKLPLHVKNSIKVYAAQRPDTYNRQIFRASGINDLSSSATYHISGFDLLCPDAIRRPVWLNYIPQPPQIFFPRDNRDPKLYLDRDAWPTKKDPVDQMYGMYKLDEYTFIPDANYTGWANELNWDFSALGDTSVDALKQRQIKLTYRNPRAGIPVQDITDVFNNAVNVRHYTNGVVDKEQLAEWKITSFICDFPYIFVTYKHIYTNEYYSGFYRNLPESNEFIEYNPFAFTGRNSNVEYLQAKWNDKTGLYCIIKDWNDIKEWKTPDGELIEEAPQIKELGWTPDTLLVYPCPEMYRLLVARLADKLAALNESNIMGIQKELTEAEFAFKAFCGKDKSSWQRIDNVNGPTITDWL